VREEHQHVFDAQDDDRGGMPSPRVLTPTPGRLLGLDMIRSLALAVMLICPGSCSPGDPVGAREVDQLSFHQ